MKNRYDKHMMKKVEFQVGDKVHPTEILAILKNMRRWKYWLSGKIF